MRVLFISQNPCYPQVRAGAEITTHFQCLKLIDFGNRAAIAATGAGLPVADELNGYTVFRGNDLPACVSSAIAAFDPTVFVILEPGGWVNRLAALFRPRGLVFYQHSFHTGISSIRPDLAAGAMVLATSADCAQRLHQTTGFQSQVVPPLFGIDRFAGPPSGGRSVLFASLQNRKGADLVVRIARARPNVQFQFLETWSESKTQTIALKAAIAELPNAACWQGQADLRPFFQQARLLLMPSRSQESWGRMASEAQTCGIPVLASSRGNLPATIGSGGVCLDPDAPLEDWLEVFDKIMSDDAFHNQLSAAGLENAARLSTRAETVFVDFRNALLAVSREPEDNVKLVRKPVVVTPRAQIKLADLATYIRLASARWQASLFPERTWPLLTRVTAAAGAVAGLKSFAKTKSRIAGGLDARARRARQVSGQLRAARHEVALQCVRGLSRQGWKPGIVITNPERLTEALADGRGCVLWVAHFVFAPNIVKMALHEAGLAAAHISRPEHGFSSSRFGIKHLNPVRIRFEEQFLRERVEYERANPLPAMQRARRILADNGVLSITAGAWEGGHIAETVFLGHRLSLSCGPMAIARRSHAALLPVFATRSRNGRDYEVHIGEPVDVHSRSDDEAMRHGMASFTRQHIPWVRAYPEQWRGWSALQNL